MQHAFGVDDRPDLAPVPNPVLEMGQFSRSLLVYSCQASKFVAMAKSTRGHTGALLFSALPAVEDLIAAYGIEPFVFLTEIGRWRTICVFEYGLPLLRPMIGCLDDLNNYGRGLLAIAEAAGSNVEPVFKDGLPVLAELIGNTGFSHPQVLMNRLVAARSSLRKPYKDSGYYGKFGGEYWEAIRDPDGNQRKAIDSLIPILQSGVFSKWGLVPSEMRATPSAS